MSVGTNSFEEYAAYAGILFINDTETNTVVIEDLGNADLNSFIPLLKRYASQQNAEKISIQVKEANAVYFFQHGFKVEASILAYYGLQDAFYIVYYVKDAETKKRNETQTNAALATSLASNPPQKTSQDDSKFKLSSGFSHAATNNKPQLIFTSRAASQAKKNSRNKFFAQIGNKIVATVNAYYCKNKQIVEFSEFTVNLELAPNKIINRLLAEIASYYAALECKTAYTIVPASSLMLNALCVENDFEFGGQLNIDSIFKGNLHNLNTWFKQL